MKNKTKILYVHHDGNFSGAPKSMGFIIKNIDQKIFAPFLINIQNGPIDEFFKELPCQLIFAKGIRPFHGSTVVEKNLKLFLRNWIFLIPSIIRANKVIKELKPDLIHLNSTCLFAFAVAAKFNKIKVISHVREPLRKGIWGVPLRFFCKKYVDGFIAICENDLKSLRIPLNNTKIKKELIYNFVDSILEEKVFDNSLRRELKIPDDSIIFLYLARFSNSNGWKELIEMVKTSFTFNSNFHFVLIGAVNSNQFKYVDSTNIHILPFRHDINTVINGSDVFICPFVEPHFARGVIEAAAFGLPIIGNNIGGVDELIDHNKNGFLYNNETEFNKFCNLLGSDRDLRIKFGKVGIQNACEKFSLKNNLQRTYDFYSLFV